MTRADRQRARLLGAQRPANPLPKGGPDRTRFCVWYAAALDEGKTHQAALEQAHGMLRLLRWYAAAGIAEQLGLVVGGLPVALQGEGEQTPEQLALAKEQMARHRARDREAS
jgi:hypothetical protein